MAYNIESTKGKISEIKKNIETKKGELSDLEKNKQALLDAQTSVQGADLDESVQRAVMDAINGALEANSEKGKELNQEMNSDMSALEDMREETQESMESSKAEQGKLEQKKALLDKLGLGRHLEQGISDLGENQQELKGIDDELIQAQRELSETASKLDML